LLTGPAARPSPACEMAQLLAYSTNSKKKAMIW